jgi:hypothetical protein
MAIKKLTERYVDIKNKKLSNSSMLRMFNVFEDEDSNYFMNIFKTLDINEETLNNPATTQQIGVKEPWWEMITYSYYKEVDLWWLACLSNNVLNPFEEIMEGASLTMISKTYIPYIQRDMQEIFDL